MSSSSATENYNSINPFTSKDFVVGRHHNKSRYSEADYGPPEVIIHTEYRKEGIPINLSKVDPYCGCSSDKHPIDIEKEQISKKMKELNPGADHYQNMMVMSFHLE